MSLPVPRGHRFTRRRLLIGGLALASGGAIGAALGPLRPALGSMAPCEARALVNQPLALFQEPRSTAFGWHMAPNNPVLDIVPDSGWEDRTVNDPCVLRMPDGSLMMWYSTVGTLTYSIGVAIDRTGVGDSWTRITEGPVLPPEEPADYGVVSPSVVWTPHGWRAWYAAWVQRGEHPSKPPGTWIESTTSRDGIHWDKPGTPVLVPSEPWEGEALRSPNVWYEPTSGLYYMWYSGQHQGEPEPRQAGLALSSDGVHWTRHSGNPIFAPATGWEDYLIGSVQAVRVDDWWYAFYLAFQREPYVGRIGMARSRDGIANWEKHPHNPILGPGRACTWNAAMVYKPAALWDDRRRRWDVWFNGAMVVDTSERIGHAWSDGVW